MIYIQENCELNLIWDNILYLYWILNIEARNSNFINKYIEQRDDIENRALDPSIDQMVSISQSLNKIKRYHRYLSRKVKDEIGPFRYCL